MDVVVFGAGSLGSLIGGMLAREHAVTLVGREPHVSTIRADGLELAGTVSDRVHPAAATEPPAAADLAVVTVKTYDTEEAAATLRDCDLDGVLSLQNGMGNETVLEATLDCEVLAGTCTYGARLVEPGLVECTGVGSVALGPRAGGRSDLADRVGAAFAESGIECEVAGDMPRRLWEKLAVNAGINAPTALARVPNGALASAPGEPVAHAAAREVASVAQDAGVDLDPDGAAAAVSAVAATTSANTSSMLQDFQTESRTEIDAINGYVVDAADRPVPVNELLAGLVRTWETDRGLR